MLHRAGSPPKPRCRPGPSATRARLLVIVTLANAAGSLKVEEPFLFAAVNETPQCKVDDLALGLDVGELHGFPDKLFVEHDIGSHDTPPYVYRDSIQIRGCVEAGRRVGGTFGKGNGEPIATPLPASLYLT